MWTKCVYIVAATSIVAIVAVRSIAAPPAPPEPLPAPHQPLLARTRSLPAPPQPKFELDPMLEIGVQADLVLVAVPLSEEAMEITERFHEDALTQLRTSFRIELILRGLDFPTNGRRSRVSVDCS